MDVLPVEDVGEIDRYDSVVLGSGVYAGRWLRRAVRFADENAGELASKTTWLFSSGPIGDQAKPEADDAVKIRKIETQTRAREHRVFAGRLERSRLHFADRAIVAAVRSPDGDFRDWEAIAEWADEIADALA